MSRQTFPILTSAGKVGTYLNYIINAINEMHLHGFNGPRWVVPRALWLNFLLTARMCGQCIKCSKLLNIEFCFHTHRRAGVTFNTPRKANVKDTNIVQHQPKNGVFLQCCNWFEYFHCNHVHNILFAFNSFAVCMFRNECQQRT